MSSSKSIVDRLVFHGTLVRSGDTADIEGMKDLMLQAADHIDLLVYMNTALTSAVEQLDKIKNNLVVERNAAWKRAEYAEKMWGEALTKKQEVRE